VIRHGVFESRSIACFEDSASRFPLRREGDEAIRVCKHCAGALVRAFPEDRRGGSLPGGNHLHAYDTPTVQPSSGLPLGDNGDTLERRSLVRLWDLTARTRSRQSSRSHAAYLARSGGTSRSAAEPRPLPGAGTGACATSPRQRELTASSAQELLFQVTGPRVHQQPYPRG